VGLSAVLLVVYRTADAQRVSTLLDIVRIGLSVGAGTGGLFALWLATRRQRSAEQTLVLQHEVSRSTVMDSTERRITDQYSKAIDQLGHEKSAVRLGAIYSLERIAQKHPEHRQTVVDVFCSYLRLPFAAPEEIDDDSSSTKEKSDEVAELEVRRTVQGMIWTHLGDPEKRKFKDKFWPAMRLDLSRTILVDPNFRYLSVLNLKCENTVAYGVADFRGIRVEEACCFGGVKFFGTTILAEGVFRGGLAVVRSVFGAEIDLSAINVSDPFFIGESCFGGTFGLTKHLLGGLVLHNCHFGSDVLLNNSEFDLLMFLESDFRGRFVTEELRIDTVVLVVGSTFRIPPERHEHIVHVEGLENTPELIRSITEQLGVDW